MSKLQALLEAVAETTAAGNIGIIGGGDSATAAAKWNMEDKVRHISMWRKVAVFIAPV